MNKEITTVRSSEGTIFELTKGKMSNHMYSATKTTWLKLLKLKVGQTINAPYFWGFVYGGGKDTGEAYKLQSGGIRFGCIRFSPSSVNTIRKWAGLRAVAAKSKKTRKTR